MFKGIFSVFNNPQKYLSVTQFSSLVEDIVRNEQKIKFTTAEDGRELLAIFTMESGSSVMITLETNKFSFRSYFLNYNTVFYPSLNFPDAMFWLDKNKTSHLKNMFKEILQKRVSNHKEFKLRYAFN